MEATIRIENGHLKFVYDDLLQGLAAEGEATITRASFVEPEPGPSGQWVADMRPSGGPVLYGFLTRREALLAERHWLMITKGI